MIDVLSGLLSSESLREWWVGSRRQRHRDEEVLRVCIHMQRECVYTTSETCVNLRKCVCMLACMDNYLVSECSGYHGMASCEML